MRELANDGFRLTLNYRRNGKDVADTLYPPFAQRLLNAEKQIRFVDRANQPGRWLVVKAPAAQAITAFVAPGVKDSLEVSARERSIDMNKLVRSALWDQNPDLDISDAPETKGPWARRCSKSPRLARRS